MLDRNTLLKLQDLYEGNMEELIEILGIDVEEFASKFYEEIEAMQEELDLV